MKGQKANSLEAITWSELIKQTIQMQAKYSLYRRRLEAMGACYAT